MFVLIETIDGYAISRDGQVIAHDVSTAEVTELYRTLGDTLRPTRPAAVTPAKARFRPPIMRYPVRTAQ